MKNKLHYISSNEIEKIEQNALNDNYYCVILDGREIQKESDYIEAMFDKFDFSKRYSSLKVGYAQDLDLSWYTYPNEIKKYNGFVLIIDYYNDFLKWDNKFKKYLLSNGFLDTLTWWNTDVLKYVVERNKKPFNIYLVDK